MKFPYPKSIQMTSPVDGSRLFNDSQSFIDQIEQPMGSVDNISALIRKSTALQWCTQITKTGTALSGNKVENGFDISSSAIEFGVDDLVDFFYLKSSRLFHGKSLLRIAAKDEEYGERLQTSCVVDHSVVEKDVWCLADAINDGDLPKITEAVAGTINLTREFAVTGPLQVSLRHYTPLIYALVNRQSQPALHLINLGASIEKPDSRGDLPIHWACIRGLTNVVSRCLSNSPLQVSARTDDGYSTLYLATVNQHPEIMKMLIDAGANVNERYVHQIPRGGKLLYCPVLTSLNYETAKILNEHNADFSMTDLRGQTPLHVAGKNRDRPLYDFLLKIGCREDLKDKRGRTPRQYLEGRVYDTR